MYVTYIAIPTRSRYLLGRIIYNIMYVLEYVMGSTYIRHGEYVLEYAHGRTRWMYGSYLSTQCTFICVTRDVYTCVHVYVLSTCSSTNTRVAVEIYYIAMDCTCSLLGLPLASLYYSGHVTAKTLAIPSAISRFPFSIP